MGLTRLLRLRVDHEFSSENDEELTRVSEWKTQQSELRHGQRLVLNPPHRIPTTVASPQP